MTDGLHEALDLIYGSPAGGLSTKEYTSLARKIEAGRDALQPVRLVLLSSFTTELFAPFIKVEGARHGFWTDLFHGGFGQFEQALAGSDWVSAEDAIEVLILCIRLEDLDPDRPFRHSAAEDFGAVQEDVLGRIRTTLTMFRERSTGPALIANFAVPEPRPLGPFDAGMPDSLTHRLPGLNRDLLDTLADFTGTFVWDYAGLVSGSGSAGWTDPRLWALARMPVAAANQPALAAHLMRTVRGVLRPSAKCVVLDLDQTLWGGAVGDVGVEGIHLGDDHPGSAYKHFQRALRGLRERGILLALCSKNDEAVAREAVEGHPDMLLRWDDFSAHRVNWAPKSQNIREVAEELDIGLDSLVLFDDNPVERAEVRRGAPEVHIVDVPQDPSRYVEALFATAVLDTPVVTAEDAQRAVYYRSRSARRGARETESAEDFLRHLEMRVTIGALDRISSQRMAQLVAKTNQFNLTTKRYTQAELDEIAASDTSDVFWLRLTDRYGDMGLIGVLVLRFEGADAEVDSLVLSCRAANRGMERTMLAHAAKEAKRRGCEALVGHYVPTARNEVVRDLYGEIGFDLEAEDSGTRRYRLDLLDHAIDPPDYIHIDS